MTSIGKHLSVASQVRRIKKSLTAVTAAATGDVADTLFTQGALLAREIKSVAPVDEDSATPGALRDSVRVEQGTPTGKKAVVVKVKAGNDETKKDGKAGKYDYGRAVEFGTQNMKPKPFFFPVYRARRKAIRSIVKKRVGKAVRKVFP